MQVIIDWLVGIGDIIVSIVSFVIDMVGDLVYVAQLIVKVLAQIPNYFSWMPGELVVLIVAVVGVAATYMILGRG